MNNSYDDLNEQLKKAIGYTVNEVLDKGALAVSTLLMSMSKEEKKLTIATLKGNQWERVYIVAYKNEHYEVCEELKDKVSTIISN